MLFYVHLKSTEETVRHKKLHWLNKFEVKQAEIMKLKKLQLLSSAEAGQVSLSILSNWIINEVYK